MFCLSGNNIYREVEFNPSYLEVINQKIDIKTTTSLTGTYYTDAGYNSSAPFKVVAPNHWLFAGLILNMVMYLGATVQSWRRCKWLGDR